MDLSQLSWRPAVEIAIIGLIIFFLLRFIRGTRGAGVARGLGVFFLIGFTTLLIVAQRARLENLLWILENLIGVSLIGAIVLFQPEIRRGLMRLGESAFRLFGTRGVSWEEEIADAAVAISRRREVGALIAIERETQLAGYTESGIAIDAVISSAVLQTLFMKNAPLHDGAAVIREGRLAAANCLLPLSENPETTPGLGTRHRAALGLSEETDAIVVVVSEETGRISIALDGRLIPDLDFERLRALLREYAGPLSQERRA